MKKSIILTALFAALVSCSLEKNQDYKVSEEGLISLRVNADRSAGTKTFVTDDKKVFWDDGDRIAVFDGTAKREFTMVSHSGTNAVFEGMVSESAASLSAVYPYCAAEALNANGTLSVSIPSEQKASSHGVDSTALVCVASCSVAEANFAFRNVTSLAKVVISEDGISTVSVRAASPVQIAGRAKVSVTGVVDSLAIASAADYCVTLHPSGQYFSQGTYYLSVLPATFEKGLAVELRGDKGISKTEKDGKQEFKRSSIVNLQDVCAGAKWKTNPFVTGTSVRILCIGNSFSEDSCEGYLYDLLNDGGIKAVIGDGYIGGCDLATHWSNANGNTAAYSYRKIVDGVRNVTSGKTLRQMLQDESWDYIVFQQGGGDQGFYSTYEPYLTNLVNYCRSNALNQSFKTVFLANWAAAKDCTNAKFAKYDNDQMKMYNAICTACAEADAAHNFDVIVNVGDAIQSGRTSYLGDSWNRDGWHLKKTYGRYCASCIFYEAITGKNCLDLKYYPAGITECIAKLCRSCAHCAALYRYQYADMSWYKNTDTEPEADGRILAKWLFDKAVSISAGHQASWTGSSVPLGKPGATSNAPGLLGYMDANAGGSGRISYYQIDKSSMTEEKAGRYILNGTPGGQPAVYGQMGGDYWIIESTGEGSFSEGDHLYATFTVHPAKYGAKYWLLEYLDGDEWVSVYPKKSKDLGISSGIDVSKFDYNIELSTNTKFDCVVDVRLTKQTPTFRIRLSCCSTYQVNGPYWTHPRNASEFRIAGTEADENLPIMKLLYQ